MYTVRESLVYIKTGDIVIKTMDSETCQLKLNGIFATSWLWNLPTVPCLGLNLKNGDETIFLHSVIMRNK